MRDFVIKCDALRSICSTSRLTDHEVSQETVYQALASNEDSSFHFSKIFDGYNFDELYIIDVNNVQKLAILYAMHTNMRKKF